MFPRGKNVLAWPLPFGMHCNSSCEEDLHTTYCCTFPVLFVVLLMTAIYNIQTRFSFELLQEYSLDCQTLIILMSVSLVALFLGTWKIQRKVITRLKCRKCIAMGGPVCPECGTPMFWRWDSKKKCADPDCSYSYAIGNSD